MKQLLAGILVMMMASSPIFSFEVTEAWGLLNVNCSDQILNEESDVDIQKPHDFQVETVDRIYNIQTIAYYTKSSLESGKITVYPTYLLFEWKLVDGAHENFKTATIYNETFDEYTDFDITNKGSVEIPYHVGTNDYDLYCYTGQTVGLIEFDILDALIVYVELK